MSLSSVISLRGLKSSIYKKEYFTLYRSSIGALFDLTNSEPTDETEIYVSIVIKWTEIYLAS